MSLSNHPSDVESAIRFNQDVEDFNVAYHKLMNNLTEDDLMNNKQATRSRHESIRVHTIICIGLLVMFGFGLDLYLNSEDNERKKNGLILWAVPVALWASQFLCCLLICCNYALNKDL